MGFLRHLIRGDPNATDPGREMIALLENPFVGQQVQQNSLYTAFAIYVGFTVFIALCFSLIRPYHQAVYAPKLKHVRNSHAPPPLARTFWGWVSPIWVMRERELIHHVGMDAAVFMRFTRMCRNILLTLSVFLCLILLPVHWIFSVDPTSDQTVAANKWLDRLTPSGVWNGPIWAQVVAAWIANIVIAAFLWWNYRKVVALRREYFKSHEYQTSMHARTLMLRDIPQSYCSDEGIARLIDNIAPDAAFARTAIAHDVKDLPKLIGRYESTVRQLEKVLAKYLKDPKHMRPTCKPSKDDPAIKTYPGGQKLDAIEYLTRRIDELELEVKHVRQGVDQRHPMPYGFATYNDIAEAHRIAYAARKIKVEGATIKLAPRPHEVIWNNMGLSPPSRSRRHWINSSWVLVLTLLWVGPNAMIAIFLVNLSNLGKVWPAFNVALASNTLLWGAVQGVLSPALLSLFYLWLPTLFRRMAMQSGLQTKTEREIHVVSKLYSFFIFNNMIIFTFFSTAWGYIAGLVHAASDGQDLIKTLLRDQIPQGLFVALCTISPFWVTWLLQRQLGAAIDLAQLWPLFYVFLMKRFANPTPRELIELTAPLPFDYAMYYNYFLFYITVALIYAGIQPLVLPAAALYFCVDVFLKKYQILYVFVTKNESDGLFWQILVDRLVAGTVLSNVVVFLTVWSRGYGDHMQAWTVIPIPFFILIFRYICVILYRDRMLYYATKPSRDPNHGTDRKEHAHLRSEKLATRFGHPALYKPLMAPLVNIRARDLAQAVYKGRLSHKQEDDQIVAGDDAISVSGYSDSYALHRMAAGQPGRSEQRAPTFNFVADSQLDFENYRNHPDFASHNGDVDSNYGGGRPGTAASIMGSETGSIISRSATPLSGYPRRAPSNQSQKSGYSMLQPSFAASDSTLARPSTDSTTGLVRDLVRDLDRDRVSVRSRDRSQVGTPLSRTPTASSSAGPAARYAGLSSGRLPTSPREEAEEGDDAFDLARAPTGRR